MRKVVVIGLLVCAGVVSAEPYRARRPRTSEQDRVRSNQPIFREERRQYHGRGVYGGRRGIPVDAYGVPVLDEIIPNMIAPRGLEWDD